MTSQLKGDTGRGCAETCDETLGCGNHCVPTTCNGQIYLCGNCIDDDGAVKVTDFGIAKALQQDNRIQIVPRRVSRRQQPRLDAGHLRERRNPEPGDLLRLQRPGAAELADTGEHAVELAEDQDRPRHTLRLPPRHRLERREDLVNADPMAGVQRTGAAYEDGSGNQVLEMSLGGE